MRRGFTDRQRPLKGSDAARRIIKEKKRRKEAAQGRRDPRPRASGQCPGEGLASWVVRRACSRGPGGQEQFDLLYPRSSKNTKKKMKERSRARPKDKGPFGAGAEMNYGAANMESDESSEDSQLLREAPLRRKKAAAPVAGGWLPDFCRRCRSWPRRRGGR